MKIIEKISLSIENFGKSVKRNIVSIKVFTIFTKAKILSIFFFLKLKNKKFIKKIKIIKT